MKIGSDITGVILAGGNSSRMGTDKALVILDGRPIISHINSTLQAIFEHVVLITNDASPYSFLKLGSFGDLYRDRGPLGGIHSALLRTKSPSVFVLACDTPYVSKELIHHIIGYPSNALVKIPSVRGRVHPLCGWYSGECLNAIGDRLERQQNGVQDFLRAMPTEIIPISPALPFYQENLLANLNSPSDVRGSSPHQQ